MTINNAIVRTTDDPVQAARFIFSPFPRNCPPNEMCSGDGCIACWTDWLANRGMKDFKFTCEFTATLASDRKK